MGKKTKKRGKIKLKSTKSLYRRGNTAQWSKTQIGKEKKIKNWENKIDRAWSTAANWERKKNKKIGKTK